MGWHFPNFFHLLLQPSDRDTSRNEDPCLPSCSNYLIPHTLLVVDQLEEEEETSCRPASDEGTLSARLRHALSLAHVTPAVFPLVLSQEASS